MHTVASSCCVCGFLFLPIHPYILPTIRQPSNQPAYLPTNLPTYPPTGLSFLFIFFFFFLFMAQRIMPVQASKTHLFLKCPSSSEVNSLEAKWSVPWTVSVNGRVDTNDSLLLIFSGVPLCPEVWNSSREGIRLSILLLFLDLAIKCMYQLHNPSVQQSPFQKLAVAQLLSTI